MKNLLIVGLLVLAACSTPPADAPQAITGAVVGAPAAPEAAGDVRDIDPATSSFEFEGFGVGKSHVGSFDTLSGTVTYDGERIVAVDGVIDPSSVSTGIDGLDNHLKNEDFFDVERCPEIRFSSTDITTETMRGQLTFHCVTREIEIPLDFSGAALGADFLLNAEEFGMSYTGVNPEVRIAFKVTA